MEKCCFWKNQEVNRRLGFSSHQLAYGIGTKVPGITDGDLASDEPATESEVVQTIMARHIKARDSFRQADLSARVKAMLKQPQIPAYVDTVYKPGDLV